MTLINVKVANLRNGGPYIRVTRDDGTQEYYDECEILGPCRFVKHGGSVYVETDSDLQLTVNKS